jgi:hypothetical protein
LVSVYCTEHEGRVSGRLANFQPEGDEPCLTDRPAERAVKHTPTGVPLHKQIFVVSSDWRDVCTTSCCTIEFQNAQLPKCGETISGGVCVRVTGRDTVWASELSVRTKIETRASRTAPCTTLESETFTTMLQAGRSRVQDPMRLLGSCRKT